MGSISSCLTEDVATIAICSKAGVVASAMIHQSVSFATKVDASGAYRIAKNASKSFFNLKKYYGNLWRLVCRTFFEFFHFEQGCEVYYVLRYCLTFKMQKYLFFFNLTNNSI